MSYHLKKVVNDFPLEQVLLTELLYKTSFVHPGKTEKNGNIKKRSSSTGTLPLNFAVEAEKPLFRLNRRTGCPSLGKTGAFGGFLFYNNLAYSKSNNFYINAKNLLS